MVHGGQINYSQIFSTSVGKNQHIEIASAEIGHEYDKI